MVDTANSVSTCQYHYAKVPRSHLLFHATLMRGTKGGSLEPIVAMIVLILGALERKGVLILQVLKVLKKAMLLDRLISYIARSQTIKKKTSRMKNRGRKERAEMLQSIRAD